MSCTVHDSCDGQEDITCPTCGTSILALISNTGDGESVTPPQKVIKKPQIAPKPRVALKPGVVRLNAVRKAVRIEMLKCIPGFNKARASAVVETYPTLEKMMEAEVEDLACIEVGESDMIGIPLAVALKLVIQ